MVSVRELLGLESRYGSGGRDDTVYQFPADAEVDPNKFQEIPHDGKKKGPFRYFYRRDMTDTHPGHTSKHYEGKEGDR